MEPTENWTQVKKIHKWFSNIMLGKMAANVHKGDWRLATTHALRARLQEELNEYKVAEKPASKVQELADIANIAMMLADKEILDATADAVENATVGDSTETV